jgi:hypothetical protein
VNKLAIAACIVVLGGCVSYDRPSVQVDLAQVLVGTWQGEVHWGRMEPRRTLVIDSVAMRAHYQRPDHGAWQDQAQGNLALCR